MRTNAILKMKYLLFTSLILIFYNSISAYHWIELKEGPIVIDGRMEESYRIISDDQISADAPLTVYGCCDSDFLYFLYILRDLSWRGTFDEQISIQLRFPEEKYSIVTQITSTSKFPSVEDGNPKVAGGGYAKLELSHSPTNIIAYLELAIKIPPELQNSDQIASFCQNEIIYSPYGGHWYYWSMENSFSIYHSRFINFDFDEASLSASKDAQEIECKYTSNLDSELAACPLDYAGEHGTWYSVSHTSLSARHGVLYVNVQTNPGRSRVKMFCSEFGSPHLYQYGEKGLNPWIFEAYPYLNELGMIVASNWFGLFYYESSWIYHEDLGWLYLYNCEDDDLILLYGMPQISMILWYNKISKYAWTTTSLFPFVYIFEHGWIYYDRQFKLIYDYEFNTWHNLSEDW